MKDRFSDIARQYARFRPQYPEALVSELASMAPSSEAALDVATGNGQVACKLARHFHRVAATDISEKQLAQADREINVVYHRMPAEQMDFPDASFDLITVAQAVHWFDFDLFYAEAERVLKPGGVLAVFGYGLFRSGAECDALIDDFYANVVGPFWDLERRWVEEAYRTIPFPFDEMPFPESEIRLQWTFENLLGYLETWSAVTHYKAHHNQNPLDRIRGPLESAWRKHDGSVVFPVFGRMGKSARR